MAPPDIMARFSGFLSSLVRLFASAVISFYCMCGLVGCSGPPAPTAGRDSPQDDRGEQTVAAQSAGPEADSDGAQPEQHDPGGAPLVRGLDFPDEPTRYYHATWATIVGVNRYQKGLPPLDFAVNDASKLRDLLRDEFGYPEDQMRFLTDTQARQADVRGAVEGWLPSQRLQADDAVLVFFAGHGLIDPATNAGYLAATDSTAADLKGTCLSVGWLRDRLAELPCRHKLVVLDSCYSGSLFENDRAAGVAAPAVAAAADQGTR